MTSTKTSKQNGQASETRQLKRILSPDLVEVLAILKAFELDLVADPRASVSAR